MNISVCDLLLATLSCREQVYLSGPNGFYTLLNEVRGSMIETPGRRDIDILIDLEESGHIRRSMSKVKVEAPYLVRSPVDPYAAFVVGQRTPDYLDQVEEKVNHIDGLEAKAEHEHFWPARFNVKCDSDHDDPAKAFGKLAGTTFPKMIFNKSPLAFIYSSTLPCLKDLLPEHSQRWGNDEKSLWFNPDTLRFDGFSPSGLLAHGLLRYTRYKTEINKYGFVEFRNGIPYIYGDLGDTRAAKWLVIAQNNKSIAYDLAKKRLAIPYFLRLPLPYARAVAMCDPLPPIVVEKHYRNGNQHDRSILWERDRAKVGYTALKSIHRRSGAGVLFKFYGNVPPVIAKTLAKKLGVELKDDDNLDTTAEEACKIL